MTRGDVSLFAPLMPLYEHLGPAKETELASFAMGSNQSMAELQSQIQF